ncbi:tumor necrosis factor receptor superfamily member 14-like isoform X4 [Phycodurus eques]|uniref:tumor necrosis factor receptor superfamily member 14-like isoform X4 n=1 Tax=Phycodurus eques TaxID=693459 RepID=UPI002ACE771B|nr:tumor necrosis factor receptor superfamily member 14-like isoform X4 [Phycodurus eques]
MPLGNNQLKAHRVLIILIYVFRGFTLQCHQTEYQLNQEQCCPKCPTGSHVRNECTIDGGSTSCRLCMNRTYMNIPTGLKHCFPCTNCNAGSGLGIKRGCTTVSDAVCKPLDGFFCVDPVADGCLEARKHTECRPGQYISLKAAEEPEREPAAAAGTGACRSCRNGSRNGSLPQLPRSRNGSLPQLPRSRNGSLPQLQRSRNGSLPQLPRSRNGSLQSLPQPAAIEVWE